MKVFKSLLLFMLSVLNRHSKRKTRAKPSSQLKGLKGKDQLEDLPERRWGLSVNVDALLASKALANSHSKLALL